MDAARRIRALTGVVSGVVGGLAFALMLANQDTFSSVADLFRLHSNVIGWAIQLVVSAIFGGLYGLIFVPSQSETGLTDGLANGALYGVIWWCLAR